VQGVFLAARAILVVLKPVRVVAAILLGYIIAFFAIIASEDDHRADIFLLGSHY
jgi:hypothetical protein